MAWSNSCKYLGVYLDADGIFKCNFDEEKAKYYLAFNGVMGNVHRSCLSGSDYGAGVLFFMALRHALLL